MKDLPRIALVASIILLSFMLLTEWAAFSKLHRNSAVPGIDIRPSSDQAHLESSHATSAATHDESIPTPSLESAPLASDEDLPSGGEYVSAAEPGGLISIESDVLSLKVDTLGGDLVSAALPEFKVSLDEPNRALVILERNNVRNYVAQSGLTGRDGIDTRAGRARFVSERARYVLAPEEDVLTVDLLYRDERAEIVKRFTLRRGDYLINVDYLIRNLSQQPWQAQMFAQIKRDHSSDPGAEGVGFGIPSYLGAAMALPDEPYHKVSFDDIAEEPLKIKMSGGWMAMVQHYFVSAWVPGAKVAHHFETVATSGGDSIIRMRAPVTAIAGGARGEVGARFYVGPKDQARLRAIANGLDLTVDYGWLWWIAQPLFWLLSKLYDWFGNWGWAIVGLTFIIKLVFFQLSAASYRSMARMRRLQPKMLDLRDRYKDDRQKLSQAMMDMYKKEKVNPLGGCLPMLVQMPVFIALYWVLLESVELRHAPFALWIKDLSIMDPYFVLPALMGLSMLAQQRLTPPPPDPLQARIMQWLPLVFTFFFLFFPAGLVLYWLANSLISIAQQWFITRRVDRADAAKRA